jgi:riboflavin kinase/FMN adenylyltransferase
MAAETGPPRIACIGKFDALHRGHRALVAAAAAQGRPVMITFDRMPDELHWQRRLPLCPLAEWTTVIAAWGFTAAVLRVDFGMVRGLAPDRFVARLRDNWGIGGVVVGEDFRFGHGRGGDVAVLRSLCAEAGLSCLVVPPVTEAGEVISSSGIRGAVAAGDLARASRWLGRPYRLHGRVAHGDGRGHGLGFPTANLVDPWNLPPGEGVYAGRARLGDDGDGLPAAISIGHVPTVAADHPLVVEAHLIGYTGDCYGRLLALDFLHRLRDQKRFPTITALRDQIAADVAATRRLIIGE